MEILDDRYQQIAHLFPAQRGNVRFSILDALDTLLNINENGCKWRALPEKFGLWTTI